MKENNTVGIILPANSKISPFLKYYTSQLDQQKIPYKLIIWDKAGFCEPSSDYVFHFHAKDSQRKRILWGHIRFAAKCRNLLKKNGITKLIILTIAPSFFLGHRFLKRYRNRFILDIRDDSPLVRRFPKNFQRICTMAKQVVTSSPKFNDWIPVDTLLCHNADIAQVKKRINDLPKQQCNQPISLVFAGMLNEGKINLEMLRHMGSDNRYRFAFIGSECLGKDAIRQFAQEQNLENITFQGAYNKDEIYDIYRSNADLVNIIRAKNTVNRNALPNKLYDAVLAGVPVVVFDHNEAIASYVQKYSLGLVLEENMETLGDTIAQKMARFDYAAYTAGRIAFLQKVKTDMEQFTQLLNQFTEM